MSRLTLERSFAAIILLFGGFIMLGAYDINIGWDRASPQPGFFPFRVGAFLAIAGLLIAIRGEKGVISFEIKPFLRFFLPLIALILLIPYLGLYISAALYLAVMLTLARLTLWKVALIAIFTPVVLYISFEVFFKMPLPKGSLWSIIS